MARLPLRLLSILSLSFGLSLGCGGSERPAASATSNNDAAQSSDSKGADDSEAATGNDSDADSSAAPEARKAACDDGTCTPCGTALCPNGWYCDESAKGGPACGWLPECARKPNCACVKRAFSGCICEEQAGAAHLSCG